MSLPRASVLVVDRDPGTRDRLAGALAREGYEVATVPDGGEAAILSSARSFDMTVAACCDDGEMEILRQLDTDLVVIVGSHEHAVAALKYGAWACVASSEQLDELHTQLARALHHRELESAVALYEASQTLLTSFSGDELRGQVLQMAAEVLRSPSTVLLLEAGECRVHGPSGDAASVLARALLADGGGRTEAGTVTGDSFGHFAICPLRVRDRALGSLVALRPGASQPFTAVELRRGCVFSAQAALALDNARIYATVEALAVVDELTGLHSRRYLFDTVRRGGRGHEPGGTSFLMVDVDHFKQVNDRHGHGVGDRVLRRVADLLMHATRETDIVARVGGEEFAVLLPGTDEQTATDVGERIRATVAGDPTEPRVTVSVGVASQPGPLPSGTLEPLERSFQLMERADAALYEAKKQGRNRVRVWRGTG